MELRRATPADVAGIARGMKVVVDEGRWLWTQSSTTEAELRDRFRSELESGHVLVVVADAGEIVGCAGVHPTRVEGVWSLGTWVLGSHRGRGLGRALIERAIEEAAARGARKIELEAFEENAAAIALYASVGFDVEGVRRDHYAREDGTIKSAVIMALFPRDRNP